MAQLGSDGARGNGDRTKRSGSGSADGGNHHHRAEARTTIAGRRHRGYRVHRGTDSATRFSEQHRHRGAHAGHDVRHADRARQQRQHRTEGRGAERFQRQQRVAGRGVHRRGVRQRDRRCDVPAVRPRSRRGAARPARYAVRPQRLRRSRPIHQRRAGQGVRRLWPTHARTERSGQFRTGGQRADYRSHCRTTLCCAEQVRRLRPQPKPGGR